MAEESGFFNSKNGDRRYYVSFMAEYFASFIGNGVYFGGNFLKARKPASQDGMLVEVTTGKAWINGYYYALKDSTKVMPVNPAHSSLARKDNVVIQLNLAEDKRLIELKVIQGVPSGNPAAPALQRDNAIYEIKIAEIFVAAGATRIGDENITDFRTSSEACGIVSSVVPTQLTYDQLFNQMSAELTKRMKEWDSQKSTQSSQWDAQMRQQGTDFTQRQDSIQTWYDSVKTNIAKLQVIDFDNMTALKGVTKSTTFEGDTVIRDIIKNNSTQKRVAEKVTTFLSNGNIQKDVTIYDTNGITVLTSCRSTIVFNGDGSITEGVV